MVQFFSPVQRQWPHSSPAEGNRWPRAPCKPSCAVGWPAVVFNLRKVFNSLPESSRFAKSTRKTPGWCGRCSENIFACPVHIKNCRVMFHHFPNKATRYPRSPASRRVTRTNGVNHSYNIAPVWAHKSFNSLMLLIIYLQILTAEPARKITFARCPLGSVNNKPGCLKRYLG